MSKGRYVDDICGGADTPEQLLAVAQHVTGMCNAACMPLAKWHSNNTNFLQSLDPNTVSNELRTFDDSDTKILGITWQPSTDNFTFTLNLDENAPVTKRQIASEIARLYDPLGLISPVIINAKLILQNLWKEKCDWDEPVSSTVQGQWADYRTSLKDLHQIAIPRWSGLTKNSKVEVHGFSDASQNAMGMTIYLKIFNEGEAPKVTLIISKTKVAPKDKCAVPKGPDKEELTIPKLELQAATILAKLVKNFTDQFEFKDVPIFLWSDSTTALTWITSPSHRWTEFVKNRVASIQRDVPSAKWNYVAGKLNPADCASRGITPAQLAKHPLWWQGPPWLAKEQEQWPQYKVPDDYLALRAQKPGVVLTMQIQNSTYWKIIEYCSSLIQLLRMTAVWLKFFSLLQKRPKSIYTAPTKRAALEKARIFWIKATQLQHFAVELQIVANHQQLPRKHPLSRLTPFIDNEGILRVGGRLKFAQLHAESKHQIILPKDSLLSKLIIRETHEDKTLHGGVQLTLATIRQQYWIVGGRLPVRTQILRCVTCARYRGERAQQLMGQLPFPRLFTTRAFKNTGLDYAGPILVRTTKGRGYKSYKGWISIFVCLATSAVHIEVVSDYTKRAFLDAFTRFTARRGIPENLYSDCGTNFIGADNELQRLFTRSTEEYKALEPSILKDGTQWHYNPPGAPHFGGKWEAAVKSVKYHLARTVGEATLTFEELSTVLTRVEAALNSRPLAPLTEDPDDFVAITPGHFLIGEALNAVPEPKCKDDEKKKFRPELVKQRFQYFWKEWTKSYIHHLQGTNKWRSPSHEIKKGSMVLLYDERFPPNKWPLARVIELHPGADGLTRVVTIKTSTTTFKRPITKLVILPIDTEEN